MFLDGLSFVVLVDPHAWWDESCGAIDKRVALEHGVKTNTLQVAVESNLILLK